MRYTCVMVLLACIVPLARGSDLSGKVSSTDGKPIADTTVYLYTAAMKTGTSILCPSCYADCGKKAQTDSSGGFVIRDLDPQLIFRVLVVHKGFAPEFVAKVDPDQGAMSAQLTALPQDLPEDRLLKGRVVNAQKEPIAGALVSPWGCTDGDRRWWGNTEEVADPLAVTDEAGEFVLTCRKPGLVLDVEVEARAMATRKFKSLATGTESHELEIHQGATVVGRLVDDKGAPVPGVKVGLAQSDRGENFTGPHEIGTGPDGSFCFPNIGEDDSYLVYGLMSALGDRGAPHIKQIRTGDDGSTLDSGELKIGLAHSVSGRVLLDDGTAPPKGTRVLLSREDAWDHLQAECDADGKFSFQGVPHGELVRLSTGAKGYQLSPRNESFDPLNAIFLMGIVDQDIDDLKVQLDPGTAQRANTIPSGVWERLKSMRLAGVK